MASSGYTVLSFTAGEQPTTAKWNLVGSNDASFNNGNGFNDGVIVNRHYAANSITGDKIGGYGVQRRNNTTNIVETASLVQSGWGAVAATTNQNTVTQIITFPVAFTNIPIIIINAGGDQASGTVALGNGGNNIQGSLTAKHFADSISGTTAYIFSTGGNWAAGNIIYFTWIAIGT